MAQKTDTTPNEFTTFVRDAGIRAFDQLAGRFGSDPTLESKTSIQKLGNLWKGMEPPDKERFFEQLITAAQALAVTAPAMIGLSKARKAKAEHDAAAEEPVSDAARGKTPEKKGKKDKKDKKQKKDKDKKKKDKAGKKKKARKSAADAE